MTVDERARHELYGTLERMLGPEATGTLMSLLPPVGWADVATRQDLDALGHRVDSHIDRLRVEMADLRTDVGAAMADLETGLRTDMADLETGLRTEMAGLRTEMAGLETRLRRDIGANQRQLLFALVGTMLTLAGLAWAALTLA